MHELINKRQFFFTILFTLYLIMSMHLDVKADEYKKDEWVVQYKAVICDWCSVEKKEFTYQSSSPGFHRYGYSITAMNSRAILYVTINNGSTYVHYDTKGTKFGNFTIQGKYHPITFHLEVDCDGAKFNEEVSTTFIIEKES